MRLPGALILILGFVVAGCGAAKPIGEQPQLVEQLRSLIAEAGPGGVTSLDRVLTDDVDRVAFLGPYTRNSAAGDVLGEDFDIEAASPWTNAEGGTVVVLIANDEITGWFAVPSEAVDLGCLDRLNLIASHEFTVGSTNGQLSLRSPDGVDC
jgi:hypothetical protein